MNSTATTVGSAARTLVVGIAEARVTRDPHFSLVTYALGSCVAVCAFDPLTRVAGLLHVMLPDSCLDRRKAEMNPYMFADTGISALVREMTQLGAAERRITIRLVGGAQVLDDGGIFSIGKRNCTAIRKALWKAGLMVDGEALGGSLSRTVRLETATGRLVVREGGAAEFEIPLKEIRYAK